MRVPDGADPVRGRHGGGRQHAGEALPGPVRRAVHVLQVDGVQGALDRAQDVPAARGVGGQLGHQLAEHLQVQHQLPHGLVEDGEVHAGECVLRLLSGGVLVAEPGGPEGVVVQDDGVGGGLDVQAHLLTARDGRADPYPLVARVEALHGRAVGPVDQALALEARHVLVEAQVQYGLDGLPGPRRGHGPGHPEPAGAPGSTPPGAHLDRLGLGGEPLRDRHGLAGRVPHRDAERYGLRIHGGADTFVEDAPEAGFHQSAVVMHAGCSLRGSG
ncbi:hypothetical protein GCM10010521_57180 [Streptomyces rameus]|uniref:Uncharacterized protein n=1 Tax=Streptomyces rameus TaxID=68261 RepID=A0ABP6HFL1_9ACTN